MQKLLFSSRNIYMASEHSSLVDLRALMSEAFTQVVECVYVCERGMILME